FIHVMEANVTPDDGMLCSNKLAETNDMELYVYGNDDRICLAARYDNLGKGASGAAVQCMNIMLGLPEDLGL
ncbi:MAG: N-acetyl-gamma-glutamyl-phosphate reductase, partial [Eubacteriales bacterium]